MIKNIIREPLLHFLLLGAGLFLVFGYFNPDQSAQDPQTIVVNRDKLLTYIQYRAKTFDAELFNEYLDKMPPDQLQQVIHDYVREEALYREAKTLQLDKNDYVARLRLIQQLEFITRGFVDAETSTLEETAVEQYYKDHRSEYYEQPTVTFTHVFFNTEQHGPEEAEALARAELKELNEGNVPFSEAPGHGDRFYYHVNYVNKEPDEITSHFGKDLQERIFALTPGDDTWYGPFRSEYGFHLVMIVRKTAGHTPTLAEIHDRVEQDAKRAMEDERLEAAIETIVDTYKVKMETIRIKS